MANKKKLTIVTPTLNNALDIKAFFTSLAKQKKTSYTLEHIVVDGGSTDNTKQIAKKQGAKIINNPDIFAEPGIYRGMKKARGDLIMVLAVDNLFYDEYALETMMSVFNDNTVKAAFPKHESSKEDTLFTKYINTFTDPFNHFVYGYASNPRFFDRVYKSIKNTKTYKIYDYQSSDQKPMIAFAQGFTIRKHLIQSRRHVYDDITPVEELIKKKATLAYVDSISVYHHTIRNAPHFVRKVRWATNNALNNKDYGIALRKKTLSKSQMNRYKIWPFYAFLIVGPVFRSIWGLIQDRESIWLFHPIICFVSAGATGYEILHMKLNNNATVSRS